MSFYRILTNIEDLTDLLIASSVGHVLQDLAFAFGKLRMGHRFRELGGDVEVLIAANPCFGLDFAAVAQIHAEIMAARNRGAAVLLVSEDLDELLELSDRLVVMFHGRFVYEARASEADLTEIGRRMAGH